MAKGTACLPSVPSAFVILACTAPAPVPASCLSTGMQQSSCRAGKWPPSPWPHVPLKLQAKKMFKTREEPPKVGDLPVQLSGFYVLHFYPLLYCGALTEWCRTKLLRVFPMVPFQSQDSCGGRMYPAEHTEQLWPAPNTHCNKSRPPFQQKPLSKLIVLLILTGLSMRQNPR